MKEGKLDFSPMDQFAQSCGFATWAEYNRAQIEASTDGSLAISLKTTPRTSYVPPREAPLLASMPTHEEPQVAEEVGDNETEWLRTQALYETTPRLKQLAAEVAFIFSKLSVYPPFHNYMRIRTGTIDINKAVYQYEIDRVVIQTLTGYFPQWIEVHTDENKKDQFKLVTQPDGDAEPPTIEFLAGEIEAILEIQVMSASRPPQQS